MKVLFGGPFNLDSLDSVSVLEVELRQVTAALGVLMERRCSLRCWIIVENSSWCNYSDDTMYLV